MARRNIFCLLPRDQCVLAMVCLLIVCRQASLQHIE